MPTRRPAPSARVAALAALMLMLGACNLAERDEHLRRPRIMDSGFDARTGFDSGGPDAQAVDASEDDATAPHDAATDASMDASFDAATATFTKPAFLAAMGQCAVSKHETFLARAQALATATASYATTPDATQRAAAQQAWRDAMAAWQQAELFVLGPAAPTTAPGGQDLRSGIYFFPLTNRCLVDQQLVSRRYEAGGLSGALASSRGLAAIEYLLFHDANTNACNPAIAINASGSWAAIEPAELAQRRASYAAAAATLVRDKAQSLVDAWSPTGGDFLAQLTMPGTGAYADEQAALDALYQSLYYLHDFVKDDKLAVPLAIPLSGITLCTSTVCPDKLESIHARVSADNIRQNLLAFRDAVEGCGPRHTGLGIDDWLRSLGEDELADRLLRLLDAAEAAVAPASPLESQITASNGDVRALHDAIKAITDLLKTELVMVLMVNLPASAGGDLD